MNSPEMWPRFYLNAIMECDPRKQPKRIREAERAIQQRLHGAAFIVKSEEQLIDALNPYARKVWIALVVARPEWGRFFRHVR